MEMRAGSDYPLSGRLRLSVLSRLLCGTQTELIWRLTITNYSEGDLMIPHNSCWTYVFGCRRWRAEGSKLLTTSTSGSRLLKVSRRVSRRMFLRDKGAAFSSRSSLMIFTFASPTELTSRYMSFVTLIWRVLTSCVTLPTFTSLRPAASTLRV